ncbi:MAG: MBL fold metallo-hydrolase [Clostridia bacterium]|nr:MBL fold metallo-hydrolase [Clostridia bacterium]
MNVKWLGHSCFLITDSNGVRVLTDPYAPETGRRLHDIEADIVTVSHHHFDHDYVAAARGDFAVFDREGKYERKGVIIEGFKTHHDAERGKRRGDNIAFKLTMDSISVLHCGDLGHVLDDDAAQRIGRVDVLLVPIGGTFTIDYAQAREVANKLGPKVVIPMHFKTPKSAINALDGLENFISHVANCAIHRLNQSEASLYPNSLGDDRVLVLDTDEGEE